MARTLRQILQQKPKKKRKVLVSRLSTSEGDEQQLFARTRNGLSSEQQKRRMQQEYDEDIIYPVDVDDCCDSSDDDGNGGASSDDRWMAMRLKPWNLNEKPPPIGTMNYGGVEELVENSVGAFAQAASRSAEDEDIWETSRSPQSKKKKTEAPMKQVVVVDGKSITVYRRCCAMSWMGTRCAKVPKQGNKFCLHHTHLQPYGIIPGEEVDKKTGGCGNGVDKEKRCHARNKRGAPCAAFAMQGSLYCNRHQGAGRAKEETVVDDSSSDDEKKIAASDSRRCRSKNQRGEPCAAFAMTGTLYCNRHQNTPLKDESTANEMAAPSSRQCRGTNRKGEPCAAFVMAGTLYCNRHQNTVDDYTSRTPPLEGFRSPYCQDVSYYRHMVPAERKCHAKNQNGEPCAAFTMHGERYCNRHLKSVSASTPDSVKSSTRAPEKIDLFANATARNPNVPCQGKNQRGEPCASFAVHGGLYCVRHNITYDRCWAMCARGGRCGGIPKYGKFCMYHEDEQPLGVIDNDKAEEEDDRNSEDQDVASRSLCRALCRDGYRCSRRSTPGNPFCNHHQENRFGEVASSDEEYSTKDEESVKDDFDESGSSDASDQRCRAIALRNEERCGKCIAPNSDKYCIYHLKASQRVAGTIGDFGEEEEGEAEEQREDQAELGEIVHLQRCRGISRHTGKRCAKQVEPDSDFCWYHQDASKTAPIDDEKDRIVHLQQCRGISRRNGKRCAKKVEPGTDFCWYHQNASTEDEAVDAAVAAEEEEYDRRCHAIAISTGKRCARECEVGVSYCYKHVEASQRIGSIEDREKKEEKREEDSTEEEEDFDDEVDDGRKDRRFR